MDPVKFFAKPSAATHRQYEALRAFFFDKKLAEDVAQKFGYKLSAFYSMTRNFRKDCEEANVSDKYFISHAAGRKPNDDSDTVKKLALDMRKKYLSVPNIKAYLDGLGYHVSERQIFRIIQSDGFTRLPRRTAEERDSTSAQNEVAKEQASNSEMLSFLPEKFQTHHGSGILCFLPYIRNHGIDKIIQSSSYPETSTIDRLSSILSFFALKLTMAGRYTMDDQWCSDRGLGLFAGLNVLPKASWFTSYSHRVTRKMNLALLRKLHKLWKEVTVI